MIHNSQKEDQLRQLTTIVIEIMFCNKIKKSSF